MYTYSTPYKVPVETYKDSYDVSFDKLIDFDCDVYLFGHEHNISYWMLKKITFHYGLLLVWSQMGYHLNMEC